MELDPRPGLLAPLAKLSGEINHPRISLTAGGGGVSLCPWPCMCKEFLSWNEVERWALPSEVPILFSVYTGTSPVAFQASKHALLYKLTKLANNCLMTA